MALVGVVLALSRAFVVESGTAFDPEAAMMGEAADRHPMHVSGSVCAVRRQCMQCSAPQRNGASRCSNPSC